MTAFVKIVALLGSILVAAAAILFIMRSRPVLLAVHEPGDPVNEPVWTVLNPMRDRSPEQPVRELFQALRKRNYSRALSLMNSLDARAKRIIRDERDHPLEEWELVNRSDSPQRTDLFYVLRRAGDARTDSPVWVEVQKRPSSGVWMITDFQAWY
jgi:hypothetical protein